MGIGRGRRGVDRKRKSDKIVHRKRKMAKYVDRNRKMRINGCRK